MIYLRHVNIVFLNWIGIEQEYVGKGIGTVFIRKLFELFLNQGYTRMDTDTAFDNIKAKKYYEKIGFTNLGITTSYIKLKNN